MIAGIAVSCFNYSAAQESASDAVSHEAAGSNDHGQCEHCGSAPAITPALDLNAIMGFETPDAWFVRVDGFSPDSNVKSTTARTQGMAALAVVDPPNRMTLTSRPVASTASALTGIGNKGALLQLDVQLPTRSEDWDRDDRENGDPSDDSIEGSVSVRSLGLHRVPLGHVRFNKHRTGIYNTVTFSIPDSLSSALDGASFDDMVFEFGVSSPGRVRGAYLFDNLRVHSVSLVQSPTSDTPIPPGYGGSVDLVVYGDAPVAQSFTLGPTQIPNGFHLKMGTFGATTVQLQLGLDGKPSLTCTYDQDGADEARASYILQSCSNGFKAGDLVNANWVHMAIVDGDHTQKIRAQLSLSPMGDLTGGGLLPPMPTFWGDADTCTPAPVAGQVVTVSTSCSNQVAQANQIVSQYFDEVNNSNPPPNWVVPPVPEFALRHGDGTPINNLLGVPPPPNDPPFDTGGDLNPGGSFDAYWRLNGNLTPTAVAGTDENKTHFDAAFTTHGVLFGEDLDMVDIKLVADTDSGETTPTYKAATSTGSIGFYVFGVELPSGSDLTISPSTGFSVDPKFSQAYDLPPIQIWIFSITLGANVDAEFNANASAAVAGVDLSVLPSASVDGHALGGINIGIASGGVDTKVNLIKASTPVTAQAKWVIDTTPQVCATTLNGHLKGDLNLSSLGGEIDLKATFGICPFCDTYNHTIFKWDPLASSSVNIFDDTIDVQLFKLPASLCTFPATASIVYPASTTSLAPGIPVSLTGSIAPNDSTVPVSSTTYAWTYTPGANASTVTVNSGGTTANPNVTFGPPTSGTTSTWTIGLTGTVTVSSAGGTQITSTASATPVTVTVSNLGGGVYITQVASSNNGPAIPDANGVLQLGNAPGTVTISGDVVGAGGTLNTTFSVAACNELTCSSPISPADVTAINAGSTTPSASWVFPGDYTYYKITMTTTSGGNAFGSASVVVAGYELF